jgi:hypothetical protein
MQVPDRFFDRFKDAALKHHPDNLKKEDVGHTRAALAMTENIDWNVGRVLAKLDELKLAGDTVVLYFSDNGPNGWRWNGGMRGRKGSTDEGGVRSPLLVRWPGHVRPGTRVKQIAGAIDLLPTLTELAGVQRVGDRPLDGRSLAPLLLGRPVEWPDRMLFAKWAGRVSVRTQRYRLDDAGRLYDMTTDPGQKRDVAGEQKEVEAKLSAAVAAWKKDVLGGNAKDTRPFPVGYREFPTAALPARDGVPHGGVRRRAPAPNCSFFTHWTARDDRITWDVEVVADGRYEVEILYTCPKADVGSTVELSFGGAKLSGTVNPPHDPPLRGAERDRTPRKGESYVKDFKPLRLGAVTLTKGRGPLTLRATAIPGKQVMDVRAVTLTRTE